MKQKKKKVKSAKVSAPVINMPVLDRFAKHKKATDIPKSVDAALSAYAFGNNEDGPVKEEARKMMTEKMLGSMIARNVAIDIAVKLRK